ncbi:MAG TPA: hypothetical protein VNX25_02385, partial [Verrucomicrobiae bacterium]|nr:hypothetical protein [Verrucomicrobiae bacterium]
VTAAGSKRVIIRNVIEAKFTRLIRPIAGIVLPRSEQGKASFEACFAIWLMHELMHALGPQEVQRHGKRIPVRSELKDAYNAVEEAKADICALWALRFLVERGKFDRSIEETLYETFVVDCFRAIRFGVAEAHACGAAIHLNTFLDAGALRISTDGTLALDHGRLRDAVLGLARTLLGIEGRGDYAAAKDVVATLGVLRPEVGALLDRVRSLPVEIEPLFMNLPDRWCDAP